MNFEFAILNFIQQNMRCGFLDNVMPQISALGNGGIAWIIFTIVMLSLKSVRKYGFYMAVSLVIMLVVCNITLKPLIARVRPFIYTDIKLIIDKPNDFSFPSGHTMVSFSAATAYFMCYRSRKKDGVHTVFDTKTAVFITFAAAVLIAFSRLYLYVHFPTDVLAAIVLGIIDGIVSAKIVEKIIALRAKKCSGI